jgi:hypothetical protein
MNRFEQRRYGRRGPSGTARRASLPLSTVLLFAAAALLLAGAPIAAQENADGADETEALEDELFGESPPETAAVAAAVRAAMRAPRTE